MGLAELQTDGGFSGTADSGDVWRFGFSEALAAPATGDALRHDRR